MKYLKYLKILNFKFEVKPDFESSLSKAKSTKMITALSWIPRGITPKKLLPSNNNDEEVDRYLRILQGESNPAPAPEPQPVSAEDEEIIKKYHLDTYDDDDEDAGPPADIVNNDPYQTGPIAPEEGDEDDEIRSTDFLLIVGKYGEDVPTLEVHLFDETQESLYVHHELLLPSFPLSIRWMDIEPMSGNQGSYAAVSSMRSEIEIWNLNIDDPICPTAVLQFHKDSVPGLSWNLNNRAALLSASIDTQAVVWSLQNCQPAAVFQVGSECKASEWCPTNATLFSVASSGGVFGYDVRQGQQFTFMNGVSIESLVWSSDGNCILTSLTSGEICVVDIRNMSEPLLNWKAHDGPANSLAACMSAPVVATVGDDQICKIWGIKDRTSTLLAEENLNVGQMFTCMFCPDKPTLLAVGGSENGTALWDIDNVINPVQAPAQ
ncbi:hypothetical protein TRFO_38598 [Tritrichomonas foetus]|uniref:Uncharacterized protein n=1 Tax=Tritrichomonas foetus TaxID=1144522 RepID=A0A1J4JDI0_9EUKA|nr:hypothetical protein TRFO_38598 [Tritrichomonas foetus]|eukprot:OHS95308.1 hypothetical protein TRFO_38598 [Tritrichomonas foetus]